MQTTGNHMPGQIIEAKASPGDKPTGSGNENQRVSLSRSQIVSLAAAGLFIAFFLPWIQFFGNASGFDFAKEGKSYHPFYFLWSIPIFSGLTVLAGVKKRGQKAIATLTGLIPFLVLGWGLFQVGKDLFRILAVSSYASLALGMVILNVARRLK